MSNSIKCNSQLIINCSTWTKDSSELYDYETKDPLTFQIKTYTECSIIRVYNEIKKLSYGYRSINNNKLASLSCDKDNFYFKNCSIPNENSYNKLNQPWFIVKNSYYNNTINLYKINIGDVIKIGRVKLKLKEIVYNQLNNKNCNANNFCYKNDSNIIKQRLELGVTLDFKDKIKSNEEENIKKQKNKKQPVCRICYCTEDEMDSDLIQPCICSGSMKYIHFSCLQQWLKTRGIDKKLTTNNSVNYLIKTIECELCKTKLPDIIRSHGKLYDIFNFIKPESNKYIIFENVTNYSYKNNLTRSLYSVDIKDKDCLKIGREVDADIRITDISVTRKHAFININNKTNELFIKDNSSKFGTLVYLASSSLKILKSSSLSLQIGRSLLTFFVLEKKSIFSCFIKKKKSKKALSGEEETNDLCYQQQNYNYMIKYTEEKVIDIKTILTYDDTESSINITKYNDDKISQYDKERQPENLINEYNRNSKQNTKKILNLEQVIKTKDINDINSNYLINETEDIKKKELISGKSLNKSNESNNYFCNTFNNKNYLNTNIDKSKLIKVYKNIIDDNIDKDIYCKYRSNSSTKYRHKVVKFDSTNKTKHNRLFSDHKLVRNMNFSDNINDELNPKRDGSGFRIKENLIYDNNNNNNSKNQDSEYQLKDEILLKEIFSMNKINNKASKDNNYLVNNGIPADNSLITIENNEFKNCCNNTNNNNKLVRRSNKLVTSDNKINVDFYKNVDIYIDKDLNNKNNNSFIKGANNTIEKKNSRSFLKLNKKSFKSVYIHSDSINSDRNKQIYSRIETDFNNENINNKQNSKFLKEVIR